MREVDSDSRESAGSGRGERASRRTIFRRRLIGRIATYVALILVAVVMLGPFAWMLSAAFKTERGIFAYPPQWIPTPPTVDNLAPV